MARVTRKTTVTVEKATPKTVSKSSSKVTSKAVPKTKKPLDSNEDIDKVYNYFHAQNRPFSVNDVVSNLHNTIGKTAMGRILDSLVKDELLVEKAYGKQTVYVVRQDDDDDFSPEEIDEMDQQINALKEELQEEQALLKAKNHEITQLKALPGNEELVTLISDLEEKQEQMTRKIRDLEDGDKRVDPEDKKKLDAAIQQVTKIYKSRRKTCLEVLEQISEGTFKKINELAFDMDLENDPYAPIPKFG